jgi:hypothetical protein
MSTIYTFHAECSTMDTLAATDELLVYDASSGRTLSTTPVDIATYVGANPGTLTSPVINSGTFNGLFAVSTSMVLATTLSAKLGFWGAAGTSAATTIAALTTTAFPTASCVGFSTTAAFASVITAINSLTSALKDCGIVKT